MSYLENNLEPLGVDDESLKAALHTIRTAIAAALHSIERRDKSFHVDQRDGPYVGDFGIALMYVRLGLQSQATGLPQDIIDHIPAYARSHLPTLHDAQKSKPGRLSPLDSHVGPAVLELLYGLHYPASSPPTAWTMAAGALKNAIQTALEDNGTGGDEVLYGRAGLLWAMLALHKRVEEQRGDLEKRREISMLTAKTTIEDVVGLIVIAGRHGAKVFRSEYHEEYRALFGRQKAKEIPLMWPWHDKIYLGAIHGGCGILAVLLQCPRDIIETHLPSLLTTVGFLTELTAQHHGHLPSSLPVRERSHPYVQICHGSPGLLLLLSVLKATYPEEYEKMRRIHPGIRTKAIEAVWEQGLVHKGIGICHGVTGNAWPMLLLSVHPSSASPSSDDQLLSRALAFLLHATELPPLSSALKGSYRTPDHPFSLFEGAAGAVCAWADACTVIEARLSSGRWLSPVLGMPGLGGVGAVPMM